MSFNSQQISLLNLAILLSILLSQTVLTKAKSYSGVRGAEQEQQQEQQQQQQQQNYRTNNQQQYNSKQQKHQQQEQHHTEASVSDEIDETKVMQQQHLQPQRQQHRLHKPHSIAKNNLIQQQQLRNTNTMPTKPIAAAATLTTMKILHTIQQHQHHGREYHKQQQQQQHKHQPHHEIVAHEQHHSHQHYHHRHHHQEEHEHHQFQHPHLQTSNPIVAHNKMQMAHQHRKHQEQQHHQHQQQQEYQKHHSATSHSHAHTPSPPPSDARAPRHTYSSYFSSTMPKRQINNNDDDHDYAEFSSPPLNASDHLERIYSSKDFAMDRDDIMHYDDYSYDEDDDFSKDYAVDDPRAYTQTDFGNYINRITTSNNHKHNGNDNEHDHQSARITRNSNRFADMAEHDPNYVNDEPYDDFDDNGVPGTLTVHKQNNYGTQEALKKSHENWTRRQRNKKAQENLALMRTVYNCNKPMPTVVRISDDATKRYSPHCILLHRCSESTGCCEYDALVCRPKDIELVDIFVYEYNGRDSPPVPTSVKAENHTACHCVLTNEKYDNTRDKRSPWRQRYERPNTPNFSSLPNRNHLRTANANEKDRNAAATNASCPTPNAMCPKHFNEDLKPACYCDCPKAGSENSPCHRLKNGEEGFAVEDRKCIANRSCKAPTCTYGDYNRESGRCPHPPRNYRQPNSQIIGFG